MSLINDMLKDLEQRNASTPGAAPIAGDVHSVAFSPAGASRWLWLLLILVGLAAAAYVFFGLPKSAPKPTGAAVPTATAPVVPSQVPTQPETQQQAAPAVAETPVADDVTNAAPPAPQNTLVYALDRELRSMPAQSAQAPADPVVEAPAPRAASAAKAEPVSRPVSPESAPGSEPAPEKPGQNAARAKTSGGLPVKQVSPEQRSSNLYRQAVDLMQQGRVAESMDMLQRALQTNAANHDARQLLVGELIDARRSQEAIAVLRDGLAVDPAQSGFRMALARLQIEAGDRQGAMETMEKGLASAGEDAEYHAFMAHLLQREERHAEAVKHYLVSLRSNPAMPNWLIGIGISLQAEKMNADAVAAFQRAIDTAQLSPDLQQFAEQRLKQLRQQPR